MHLRSLFDFPFIIRTRNAGAPGMTRSTAIDVTFQRPVWIDRATEGQAGTVGRVSPLFAYAILEPEDSVAKETARSISSEA
jgi:hypothetical protein